MPIPGETNRSLALLNVQLADAGEYSTVVSNFAGSATSQVARSDGERAGVNLHASQSQSAKVGQTVAFRAVVSGTEPISYQWRLNGTDIPGATNSVLPIAGVRTTDAGAIRFSPGTLLERSKVCPRLTINEAPKIIAPPLDQFVCSAARHIHRSGRGHRAVELSVALERSGLPERPVRRSQSAPSRRPTKVNIPWWLATRSIRW